MSRKVIFLLRLRFFQRKVYLWDSSPIKEPVAWGIAISPLLSIPKYVKTQYSIKPPL